MCKVKQIDCIVNYLEAKTELIYFPKILHFTQMLKRFGIWKQKFTKIKIKCSYYNKKLQNWIDWSGTDKLIVHSNFSLLILHRFSWFQHPLFFQKGFLLYL